MTDPVILACGDLVAYETPYSAGNLTAAQALVAMEAGMACDVILGLGDISNDQGTVTQYVVVETTLAPIKAKMRPVPGNHDYLDFLYGSHLAPPYFAYFGAAAGVSMKGWYSFDLDNNWHVIALNSVTEAGVGVDGASEQGLWLAADLAANAGKHIIAYWHHPVRTSTIYGDETFWKTEGSFWHQLYEAGAEIVLNGHSHIYERYARMDWQGNADPNGIRQFVVGTGMSNHAIASTPAGREAYAGTEIGSVIGTLRLTLYANTYSWQYVSAPVWAYYSDAGNTRLHNPAGSPLTGLA